MNTITIHLNLLIFCILRGYLNISKPITHEAEYNNTLLQDDVALVV